MSESSHAKSSKPLLNDVSYNVIKRSATIVLPALATLYFALAQLWNFPEPEKVVASITAFNTFLGVVVQISKKSYYASGAQYDGEIQIEETNDKKTVSLVLNGDPNDLENMNAATFKVNGINQ
jgi:hypothetical protein